MKKNLNHSQSSRINPESFSGNNMKSPIDLPLIVGKYEIYKFLGEGNYGYIFEAKNSEADGDPVALKWLKPTAEENGAKRFEIEIWALKEIDSKYVPKLIDSGEEDGRPWFTMTLAKGDTLESVLERNIRDHERVGAFKLIRIIEKLLEGLKDIHDVGITHRDIKIDNVIITTSVSHLMIVDLGVCKSQKQPSAIETLDRIGGLRFSPPEKIRHSSVENPKHDVFSVGVIGYLLLTNTYPWSINDNQDPGHMIDLMNDVVPSSIETLNNTVPVEVTNFIDRLLEINDQSRPSSPEALNIIQDLADSLRENPKHSNYNVRKTIQFDRVIRDPLYGDVKMTQFEWEIMSSPQFQRLRRIKQLGFTNLVYPGAEHTRFSHSVGTVKIVDRILNSIEDREGQRFSINDRLMTRLYALVHDITHIPYGHTLEDELGIFERHDKNRERAHRLLLGSKSFLGEKLRRTTYGEDVLQHFDLDSTITQRMHLKELIESPFGADVLDYINRDSYFCGLDHRVDSAIYRRFSILKPRPDDVDELHMGLSIFGSRGLRMDATFAMESVLLERYSLFLKVYTHSAKLAAGAMFGRVIDELSRKKNTKTISEEKFEQYGDEELLLRLATSAPSYVKKIITMIQNRNLFKMVFVSNVLEDGQLDLANYQAAKYSIQELGLLDRERKLDLEKSIAKRARVDYKDIVVYCSGGAPGIQKVRQWVKERPGDVIDRDERYAPNSVAIQRHLRLWKAYVFVNPDLTKEQMEYIGQIAAAELRMSNQIEIDRGRSTLVLTGD